MADVTYNPASFPALVKTLVSLMRKPKPPLLLMGYKERDAAERSLWTMLGDEGIVMEQVGSVVGREEPSVEIWTGRVLNSRGGSE